MRAGTPWRCLGAALLFGGAGAIGPALQSVGVSGGYYLFNAMPYVLTLIILVATCSTSQSLKGAPMELGVSMSGLGGLNKSPNGVVIGLAQLQLPVVETPAQLKAQAERICWMVGKARRNLGTMDLVVFPEYALHGLPMSTAPEVDGQPRRAEVASFKAACIEHPIWGCFSIMEANPGGNPTTPASSLMTPGQIQPTIPQAAPLGAGRSLGAGQHGHPVCEGPQRQQDRADHLPRRHVPRDGARAAYKGAEIILRTAGYTAPIRHAWKITNQANAFQNLAITASASACADRTAASTAWAKACSATSTAPSSPKAAAGRTRSSPPSCGLTSCAGAGALGRGEQPPTSSGTAARGREGRAQDCPYTFMQDMVAGRYQAALGTQVTDGTPLRLRAQSAAIAG